jgi:hypothetical protein
VATVLERRVGRVMLQHARYSAPGCMVWVNRPSFPCSWMSGASALAICCAGFEVGIHLFSRLYLAVESVQMDFLPLEEALQAQGLRSKASTTECSSRLYLSTTAISSSSSKVNTAAVSSYLWSCMIYVFALSRVALVAFRVRFCKHACGCDGIIVSRPYGDNSYVGSWTWMERL